MRYRIYKKRHIEEQPDQDVYFWDGEVCVSSSTVTVGDPATTTISVPSLHGVDFASRQSTLSLGPMVLSGCVAFFGFMMLQMSVAFAVAMFVCAAVILWKFFNLGGYDVTLRMGGVLNDHIFTSRNRRWAERFASAVGQAIAHKNHGGSGGQYVASEAILPDPVFTRN